MTTLTTLGQAKHLTHKANLKGTRYGWLRLTPAYSVHLVSELLDQHDAEHPVVLDPFCGTGTTALVCAERGVECDTTDINPFLLWLARAKMRRYTLMQMAEFERQAWEVAAALLSDNAGACWAPPLHQIEKWWDPATLASLSRAICTINAQAQGDADDAALDLLKVAFCQMLIERANVSFGHQSMSFQKASFQCEMPFMEGKSEETAAAWQRAVSAIRKAGRSPICQEARPILCDARNLALLPTEHYTCVITSPPYPNRMSYIRELRPYMYWLGYLQTGRDAGELDWQAIGGTWGCATSNVGRWQPEQEVNIPHKDFASILARIAQTSPLLSRYVHKYFYDMALHAGSLFRVMKPGGEIHYIVGNSKFYDVLLPVEEIFAALFRSTGFETVTTTAIRKRTSKKELYEYRVSARKPGDASDH